MKLAFCLALVFVVGLLTGARLTTVFWTKKLHNPKSARLLLQMLYARAGRHWLAPTGKKQRVCPSCGWHETAAIAPPVAKEARP